MSNAGPSPEQRRRYALAVEALNRGDWTRAEDLAVGLQHEMPPHGGLHFVAGVAALHRHQAGRAAELLRRANALTPGRPDYQAQWARALAAASFIDASLEVADAAAAQLQAADAMTCDALGTVFAQANAHAKAAAMFQRAVEREPEHAPYRFSLGTALLFTGDLEGAERELERCIALAPRFWKAHLALAQLRRQTPEHQHLERLQGLVAQADDDEAQLYLQLALAKEYDDLGDTPKAFEALVRGKAAGRRRRPYDPEQDVALFAALAASDAEPASVVAGCDSEAPIFVFGMPRSGTTLVERILSRHPDVSSAGELPDFSVALKRASGSRTANVLDLDTVSRARALDWDALGSAYVAGVRRRRGDTPRFVDKLPHNFLYAGHIARALPAARMICVRRDPVDTCLANFRQLFAVDSSRYDYSYDLLDTGRYYLLFDRLMGHWHRQFPGRILEMAYEDLVEHQEDTTRRLLAFCGLAWDPACLRFEENDAPVATASAAQVREPLYRSAMGRWKRYAPYLGDLLRLLEAGGARPHGDARE